MHKKRANNPMTIISLYILSSVILVSLISLIGLFTLSFGERVLQKSLFLLVSLATGALLGDAFIHLIPESYEKVDKITASLLVISGILLFFVLEKVLHWHHYHGKESEEGHFHDGTFVEGNGIHPVGKMVLISDGIHNFLDGVVIAASYLAGLPVGIATTIAVILHEIPQEVGDFGVLIHAGYGKSRALFLNFMTAILAVLGAIAVMILGDVAESITRFVVPIAAGGFIYIAASDLIPLLHRVTGARKSLAQFVAILIGVLAMLALAFAEHKEPVPEGYAIETTVVQEI